MKNVKLYEEFISFQSLVNLEIENIPYIDLSKIDYKKRQDFVVKEIIK
jgi:hypothetical protein